MTSSRTSPRAGRSSSTRRSSEVITALADAAETGALLVTCRYPLPGPDRFLAQMPGPAAVGGGAAADVPAAARPAPTWTPTDQRLLTRTIGGHPRLIEFTDALLRGGRSSLRHVQARLRDLARDQGIDLAADRPVAPGDRPGDDLGSADILLTELLALLTPRQAAVLAQVAVCRAPMTLDDLAFTLTPARPAAPSPARTASRTWRAARGRCTGWPT